MIKHDKTILAQLRSHTATNKLLLPKENKLDFLKMSQACKTVQKRIEMIVEASIMGSQKL